MTAEKDERLMDMKRQYDQLSVPGEARKRMEEGIAAARAKKRRGRILHIVRNTGMTAAAAMLIMGVMVNTSPGIANAMEDIPVLGAIAKVVTFRTFEDRTDHFEANIQVPQVSLGDGGQESVPANKSIEEYADQLVKQYENDLAASQGQGNYSLTSSYDVVTDNDRYLSVRINTLLIMASGTEFVKIFTVDKSTGEVVTLDRLLTDVQDYKQKISDNIKQQMTEQMAADENVIYFYGGKDMGGGFEEITGGESFYIDEAGRLVITFDEYQVAPGYMGSVEFTIPESVTGELMKR